MFQRVSVLLFRLQKIGGNVKRFHFYEIHYLNYIFYIMFQSRSAIYFRRKKRSKVQIQLYIKINAFVK